MSASYFITGAVPPDLQIFSIIVSSLLLLVILNLVRSERLKEGYAIVWLLVAAFMVVFSLFAGLLDRFARIVGISYAPAALFLILVGGLFMLSFHFSLLLCRYDTRIRHLAQEHAMLKEVVERNNKRQEKQI